MRILFHARAVLRANFIAALCALVEFAPVALPPTVARAEEAQGAIAETQAENAPAPADAKAAVPSTQHDAAPQREKEIVYNPLTHTGPFYSGVLQRALGMNEESPVKLGGIFISGANYLASGGLKPHLLTGDLLAALSAGVDMEKLVNFPGGDIVVSFVDYQGARTLQAAGSVGNYDGIAVGSHFSRQQLMELWWRQRLLNDMIVIKAGKINAQAEFGSAFLAGVPAGSLNTYDWWVSGLLWGAFGNPTMFGYVPQWPTPAWGAIGTFQPTSNAYLRYGIFDGNNANPNGWDTGRAIGPHLNNGYKFHIGQIGYSWLLGDEGKPGQLLLGAWGQTGTLITPDGYAVKDDFLKNFTRTVEHGARGYFAGGYQRLWYERPGVDPAGLLGWFQFGYTNSLARQVTRYAAGGLTYLNPFQRYGDAISLGVAWNKLNPQATAGAVFLSNDYVPPPYDRTTYLRGSELMFQAMYHVTWVENILYSDIGYTAIPRPGYRPGIPAANILMVRSSLVF